MVEATLERRRSPGVPEGGGDGTVAEGIRELTQEVSERAQELVKGAQPASFRRKLADRAGCLEKTGEVFGSPGLRTARVLQAVPVAPIDVESLSMLLVASESLYALRGESLRARGVQCSHRNHLIAWDLLW